MGISKRSFRRTSRAASLAVLALLSQPARAGVPLGDNQYFDVHDNAFLPGTPNSNLPSDYTAAPFLSDATASAVQTYLTSAQAAGAPLAVKISKNTPLTNGGPATQLFNQFSIKYVFADFEDVSAISETTALVNQVRGSTQSQAASVGNFSILPITSDPARSPTSPDYNRLDLAYRVSGVNLSYESLQPGEPTFRQFGRDTTPDGTPVANLRTGFFMEPLARATTVSQNLAAGQYHIPLVSRFNNLNNPSLDSDGNPSNGFAFNNPTGDQMVSRQDFEVMMLHLRMRGVNGFVLGNPGVVGYTQAQFQADARKGWEADNTTYGFGTPTGTGNSVNTNPNGATPLTLSGLDVQDALDGQYHNVANEGVIYSGVVNALANTLGSTGEMSILVSNVSSTNKYITLPTRLGGGTLSGTVPNADASIPTNPNNGAALPSGSLLIAAGAHRLLDFARDASFNWQYVGTASPFDTDPTATSRAGTGIDGGTTVSVGNTVPADIVPEPTALVSVMGLGAVALLRRRRD